jgi:hypothetical protein
MGRATLLSKAVIAVTVQVIVLALLLFIPAGTLGWWRAWVYLGLIVAGAIVSAIGLLDDEVRLRRTIAHTSTILGAKFGAKFVPAEC